MSTNLRKYAKGKPCYVRIEMVCNHDPETTVLAHLRMAGITGVGQKSPDALACPACFDCHTAVDRNPGKYRLDHLHGIMRWQFQLIRDGILKW